MKNLVIVESPTKCRTLTRFLGGEYRIEATIGHIRDLPKKELGVDVEKSFKPAWVIVSGKRKRVAELKKIAKGAKKLLLATDPDREGEAIAWHAMKILGYKDTKILRGRKTKRQKNRLISQYPSIPASVSRVVFHEITKDAVQKALKNPRSIDLALVDAQKARRVLDRLVGYKLSPLLWKKIQRGLSAGRVQSVAVRLVVEREREIEEFTSEEYWRILAGLSKDDLEPFLAELVAKSGEKYESRQVINLFCGKHTVRKTKIENEKKALEIIKDLTSPFIVSRVEKEEVLRYPSAPFTTSTLQQTAGRRFGWSGKMTMRVAQSLYEQGLITYHRTDSTNLAKSAVFAIRKYIKQNFGDDYLPKSPRIYKTKSKVAQEAHEAIRPTNIKNRELGIKNQDRLYKLIWQRAAACQMTPARLMKVSFSIHCGNFRFESYGQRMVFDGFLKVYPIKFSENILPAVKKGEKLGLVSLGAVREFTKPPPRYNEATLVKTLEQEGIGRPSTYAPTLSTIQDRQYVEKVEGKFKPTELGLVVNDFLVKHFGEIVNLPFTTKMEDDLDEIANGKKKWVPVVEEFYQPFSEKLAKVSENAKKVKVEEKLDEKCSKCGAPLIVKFGRYGKFVSCSKFPECDFKKAYIEKIGQKCPDCGGEIIVRKTKRGKVFYGCSNYPKCKWASWQKPKT